MSQRRLSNPITTEFAYDDVQREHELALHAYKGLTGRVCPTWPEVLAVALSLGYRKVAEPEPAPRFGHAKGREGRKRAAE